jgi:cAMP phosphodiesterase
MPQVGPQTTHFTNAAESCDSVNIMEVRIIGSSPDSPRTRQHASSYLINGTIVIDAGAIGFWNSPQAQGAIQHLFLTHTHMDHIASLPIFLDNAYDPATEPVTLHATNESLAVLQDHIFNDKVWPDFLRMKPGGRPFVNVSPVRPGQVIELEGLRILPVPVNHTVPTVGYIVTDGRSTAVFGGDSGPTQQVWEAASGFIEPRTAFVEASFPNSMRRLAELSLHLTPEMVGEECKKMPPMQNVFIIHIKPRFREAIEEELMSLRIEGMKIVDCDGVYSI